RPEQRRPGSRGAVSPLASLSRSCPSSISSARIFASKRWTASLRPLVLVFEDLHWIDTSTEEYLSFLMDSVAAVPLLLLVIYRVGYTPPFGSRSFHTTLTLRSLSEAESLAMAGRVLGSAQFPAELHTPLMAK